MFTLPSYEWRGKRYKSISPLMRAVDRAIPHFSIGFEAEAMVVTLTRGGDVLRFAREIKDGCSHIAAEPTREA